jgi:hypothetical protein
MNDANLQLSAEEMRLVRDPGWILTKNSIIGKVVGMFAGLSEEWREAGVRMQDGAGMRQAAVPVTEPKISKGENYKGLPYVMLDYPRVFGKEDVMAVRTMFWWGHAFSVTLHLKGKYLDLFLPVIRERAVELSAAGFEVGIAEDEWEHAHTPETYRPFSAGPFSGGPLGQGPFGEEGHIALPFLKLSARCGLEHWNEAPLLLSGLYQTLIRVLVP